MRSPTSKSVQSEALILQDSGVQSDAQIGLEEHGVQSDSSIGQEEIGVQSDLTYQESGVVTDLNLQTLGPQDTYRGPHD